MRVELEKLNGQTVKFTGVLEKKGSALVNHKHVKTYCMVNICDYKTGKELTDHVWIITNKLDKVKFGVTFSFVATVEVYYKLHKGVKVKDFCLVDIKYVKVL